MLSEGDTGADDTFSLAEGKKPNTSTIQPIQDSKLDRLTY